MLEPSLFALYYRMLDDTRLGIVLQGLLTCFCLKLVWNFRILAAAKEFCGMNSDLKNCLLLRHKLHKINVICKNNAVVSFKIGAECY
jgi:hypothetical protein